MKSSKPLFLAFFSAVVFLFYLFHMPPTFIFGDGPELAVASKSLGIAHAPGYPLYSLLSHFFSYLIPVSDYALRCNIFSIFVTILTLLLIFFTLSEIGINVTSAFLAVTLLALSESFFKQAIITEVYSLNSLFFASFLFLMVKFEKSGDRRLLLLTSFLLGIGFGNHHTILSAIFVMFIFLLIFERSFKLIFFATLFLIFGVTVYLYLPLRALTDPLLNFGDPKTLERFWQVITRWQFGFAGKAYAIENIGAQSLEFLKFINKQFYPIFIFVALLGIFYCYKEKRRLFFVFLAIFLINGILTVYVLNPDENEYFLVNEFLTPSLIVFSCFFAIAIERIGKKKVVYSILIALLIIGAIFKYYRQKDELNMRHNIYAKKLAYDTLALLPANAVVIGESDYTLFPLLYLQKIQELRKDITVLDADFFMLPWYQEQNVKRLPFLRDLLPDISEHGLSKGAVKIDFSALEAFKLNQSHLLAKNIREKLKYNIFFTYDFAEMAKFYRPDIYAKLVPFGTVFELCIDEPCRENYPPLDTKSFEKPIKLPFEEAILLTPYLPYLRREAENAYLKMEFDRAASLLENVYLIEPNIYNGAYLVIVLAEGGKDLKRAEEIIGDIMKNLTVPDPNIYLAKAVLELKKGNVNEAVQILSGIEARYPQLCEASYYLLEAYSRLGDIEKSQSAYERVMRVCGDYYKYRATLLLSKK